MLKQHRPYYESKAEADADADADKPSIREQHEKTGSGQFLFDRTAAEDYETALKLVGGVPSSRSRNSGGSIIRTNPSASSRSYCRRFSPT